MFFNLFKNEKKITKIGYEDIIYILKYPEQYILINTLPKDEQTCLIKNTLSIESEISIIDHNIEQQKFNIKIVIYGKNSCDFSVDKKYKQLLDLGFTDIYIYSGGMFEWLMLQDIYGTDEFKTTSNTLDILQYRPKGTFNILKLM